MNPIIYAIPVFMLTIAFEFWWAYRFRQNQTPGVGGGSRQIYNFSDTMSSITIGVLSRVATAFPRILTVGIYVAVYQQFATMTWDLRSPVAWIAAFLLYDFFYYWKHRANHEVRIMWAGHITHHNSEYFNLSTALRQASTTFVFDWIFYLPMAVMGIPWQMFVLVALGNLLYQYWVHTELIGRLGWFDRVFVSPSNHRVHHGQDDYCIDKNYGGVFVIWDRFFGTFADEHVDSNGKPLPISYGVRTNLQSFNPLWGNWHYYAMIWQDFKAAKGLSSKLETLFSPPSGWTGSLLDNFDAKQFKRYDISVSKKLMAYVTLQLVFNIFAVCAFLYVFPKIDRVSAALLGLWMTTALVAPVALLESKLWSLRLEIGRWVVLPILLWLVATRGTSL